MPSCADSLRSSSTGAAVGADADRHPQPVPVGPRRPALRRRSKRVRVADAEQLGQAQLGGERRRRPLRRRRTAAAGRAGGRAPRPRPRLSGSACPTVGAAVHRVRVPSRPAAPTLEHQHASGRAAAAAGASRSRIGDAVDAAVGRQVGGAGQVGRRRGRPPRAGPSAPGPAGLNRGRLAEHVVEQSSPARPAALATSRTGPSASDLVGVRRVRQPLHPLPVGRAGPAPAQTAISRSSGAWNVASWAAWPGPAPARPARAPRTYTRAKPRSDSADRQVGHHRVRVEEAAQRAGGHRLELLQRPGHRRHQRGGQRLRADADPDHAEVGVGRAPLPQPVAVHGGPQPGRVGMPVEQRRPAAASTVSRTRRRSPARWRRYSRRAAIISAFFGDPARCPTTWPASPARRRRTCAPTT